MSQNKTHIYKPQVEGTIQGIKFLLEDIEDGEPVSSSDIEETIERSDAEIKNMREVFVNAGWIDDEDSKELFSRYQAVRDQLAAKL